MPSLRIILVCLAFAGTAHATTVLAPTFPELVAEADAIVRATVTAVEARPVATPHGPTIHTFVTLTVEDCLKGTAPRQLTLTLAGGTAGEKSMSVAGMPQFQIGDREILFVQGNGRQFCPLVGFYHGRYRLLTDATTGRDYVARDNRVPLTSTVEVGLPMLDPARIGAAARTVSAGLSPADFVALIRLQRPSPDAQAR